jgi:thiol-disulfide isomerase/thioredoxin
VLYGKAPAPGKTEGDCPASSALRAQRLAPLAHGDIAALAVDKTPKPAVLITFDGADGRKLSLADFRGRALILNLWATWCVPCRAEMPALDRLEAKAGGKDFEVVAVNVDTARLERPKAFLDGIGVKSLARYADPTADSFESLRVAGKALGLPTSLLIDKDGCELGVVAGPVDWDSADAAKVVEALKGG